jgi:hypothetical protein
LLNTKPTIQQSVISACTFQPEVNANNKPLNKLFNAEYSKDIRQ